MTAASGSTSSRPRMTRKMEGSGFTLPWTPEEIHASTSSEKCPTKASRSRLVFETSPIESPCRRSSASTGSVSS